MKITRVYGPCTRCEADPFDSPTCELCGGSGRDSIREIREETTVGPEIEDLEMELHNLRIRHGELFEHSERQRGELAKLSKSNVSMREDRRLVREAVRALLHQCGPGTVRDGLGVLARSLGV